MINSREQVQPVNSLKKQRRVADHVATQTRPSEWGWLPVLTLVGALGLVFVAVANLRWRGGMTGAVEIFWIGLLTIYVPIALRLAFPNTSREERIALIIILALTLYAVKLLNSPLSFKNFDELLHWRTANDIIQTGKLFNSNPVLPVSPYYPGMENIVSALNKIGGFDVYWAGVIVIGIGRIVFVISLYMFYRRVSGSEQLAGIATLLYMANPSFLFFGAMFSYESLALPFAGLAMFAITRWLYGRNSNSFSLTLVMAIAMGAVIVTHHITTYAMLGIVALWTIVDTIHKFFYKDDQPHIGWIPALIAVVFSLIWILSVAPLTINYLVPEIKNAAASMFSFLSGESSGRVLFSTHVGTKAPLVEQISGYAAILLIMVLLSVGLLQIWKRHIKNIPVIMLGVGAVGYPVSQAFRLVHTNADIPGRSAEFVFVALSLVMAIGIIDFVLPHLKLKETRKYIVVAMVSGIIFMGSAAVGWKPLPPGQYLVSAGARSVDEQSVAAALWARTGLEPDHRIAADRINGVLMLVYGQQYQVTLSEDWIQIPDIFFAPQIGPDEGFILWEGQVEYLVVDRRLSTALPFLGFYFEQSETGAFEYTKPIDPYALSKFDEMENVSRLYDNGNVRIYDVRKLWNEP